MDIQLNLEYWKYDYETTALYVDNKRVEQLDTSKYYELSSYTCSKGEIVEYDRLYKKITIDSNKQTKCSLYFNEVSLNPNDYVKRNVVLIYDGEYNTSSGHNNSSTTWYDWSGNSNTGTLNGPVWGSNYLEFDGVNDWVKIGQHNYNQYEIQIVLEPNNVTSAQTIIANYESGGYGVDVKNSTVQNEVFISSSYVYTISNKISNNTMYSISSTFDISNVKLYINNNLNATTSINNIMGKTTNSTILAIGANPGGSTVTNSYFNGKIYSIRFYNLVLSDEERTYNYNIDRIRFGL